MKLPDFGDFKPLNDLKKQMGIVKLRHPDCIEPAYFRKFCIACKDNTLHLIKRYAEPTIELRSYHYECLKCQREGEE